MELILLYYSIAAIAASITSYFYFYLPAMRQARSEGVDNVITQYPIVGSVTYIVITAIMAPFIVTTLLIPSHGERYGQSLYKSICKPDD